MLTDSRPLCLSRFAANDGSGSRRFPCSQQGALYAIPTAPRLHDQRLSFANGKGVLNPIWVSRARQMLAEAGGEGESDFVG